MKQKKKMAIDPHPEHLQFKDGRQTVGKSCKSEILTGKVTVEVF